MHSASCTGMAFYTCYLEVSVWRFVDRATKRDQNAKVHQVQKVQKAIQEGKVPQVEAGQREVEVVMALQVAMGRLDFQGCRAFQVQADDQDSLEGAETMACLVYPGLTASLVIRAETESKGPLDGLGLRERLGALAPLGNQVLRAVLHHLARLESQEDPECLEAQDWLE